MGLHADLIERNNDYCWYNDGYFDYRIGNFKLWYNRFDVLGIKHLNAAVSKSV
jgi:hypothetical protein